MWYNYNQTQNRNININQIFSQTGENQQQTPSTYYQDPNVPSGKEEARFASRLLLLSSLIVNLTSLDPLLVTASIISITANLFLIRSAFLEANAQQVAPGVTTRANMLKIIGTSGNLIISLILFAALLIEVSARATATTTGVAGVTPAASAGSAAAFIVS